MQRWAAAGAAAALGCALLLAATSQTVASAPSGRSSPSVKVSPSRGLMAGESVIVTGTGVSNPAGGGSQTWFVAQCTAAVRGHFDPSTDTPHCNLTAAKAIHITRNGTFTTHFQVATGIIGDGYCGTAGHLTCVLGVGTANGLGTVVKITFRSQPPYPVTGPTG
jgi:hypothetical protein